MSYDTSINGCSEGNNTARPMKKWNIVILLCLGQFVMVLDSTVMNVSMSEVAKDLGTTITGLQTAITFYTLTMAAFMMTGGKFGDIWGRLKAFRIGSVVYALGSFLTAISGSLGMLIIGWSVIEGLGAVLVIPAIAALIAANYTGKDRVVAFAAIGGISGAAAAAGPLIGGFMTTYLSWRYVFAGETVVMILLLFFSRAIKDADLETKEKLDVPSAIFSASGMALAVYGILQSKTWGWIQPAAKPEINGHAIAPFGISIVAYLIVTGLIILRIFYKRQQKLESTNSYPLIKVSMFKLPHLRAGLLVLMSQYLITASLFFVIPVYLQIVLGYDALSTGVKIIPLSVGLILMSVVGSRLAIKYTTKQIIKWGQYCLILGSVIILASINEDLKGFMFGLGLFVAGGGLGLLASQIGNVIMTSVKPNETSQAGGLQGTSQNLGSSLGTALIGSVLITSLTAGFVSSINQSTLPQNIKTYIDDNTTAGVQVVSATQVEDYAVSKGVSQSDAEQISQIYKQSQIGGLREATFFIVILAGGSLILSKNIPNKKIA